MTGETDLKKLLSTLKPLHNEGEYVFCVVKDSAQVKIEDVVLLFKEREGDTIVVRKELADSYNLNYSFVASWITLTVHSSLEAVGLTAAFSTALAEKNISCNVVAAYYHDHIFVDTKHLQEAMTILNELSGGSV